MSLHNPNVDFNEAHVVFLVACGAQLEHFITELKKAEREGRAQDLARPDFRQAVGMALGVLEHQVGQQGGGFLNTIKLIMSLGPEINADSGKTWTWNALQTSLETVRNTYYADLSSNRWVQVDAKYAEYFVNPSPWGPAVHDAFPAARADVIDAGFLLGANMHTASVFHSIRVAEFGLRHIARSLKVRLTNKGKPMPLEHAEWHDVITAIENKVVAVKTLPKGKKKVTDGAYYSQLLTDFGYLREVRNTVSHARYRYTEKEAQTVFERVRGVMTLVAERTGPPRPKNRGGHKEAKRGFADQTAVDDYLEARGGTAGTYVLIDLGAAGVM
jgi:hypothetical protein